jgi:hypothetical protein
MTTPGVKIKEAKNPIIPHQWINVIIINSQVTIPDAMKRRPPNPDVSFFI